MSTLKPAFSSTFEEPNLTRKLNQVLTFIRDYPAQMPPPKTHVLLLISGGLDSTLLWLLLALKYKLHVHPIHLQSLKKPSSQTKYLKKILPFFQSQLKNLYHQPLFLTYQLPLKSPSFQASPPHLKNWNLANLVVNPKTNQTTVMAIANSTRLFHFTAIAVQVAHQLRLTHNYNLTHIFFGLVPEDAQTARESTLTTLRSLTLTTTIIFGDPDWQLLAPIDRKLNFYYPKPKLLQYGARHNFPFHLTWSCDYNGHYHCGLCYSCRGRKEAFQTANLPDPTPYRPNLNSLQDKLKQKLLTFKLRWYP